MGKPVIVIMAGGRGERFWPRSRRSFPKQLIPLIGETSLLQDTFQRVRELTDLERIFVVINQDYQKEVSGQLRLLPKENIIVEPEGRNTAPCIALAATYIKKRFLNEDPPVVILPSDSLVLDVEKLRSYLKTGISFVEKLGIGLIYGTKPNRPETGFGYIELGPVREELNLIYCHEVAAFKEKPNYATAKEYIANSKYMWNAGIFVWGLKGLMHEFELNQPEIAAGMKQFGAYIGLPEEMNKLTEMYGNLPAISFDYGILEKTTKLGVIPASIGWDDLGSWGALERLLPKDKADNAVQGNFCGVDTSGCVVYSPQKMVATLGVQDLVIVETEDALLVAAKDKTQEIKKIIEKLAKENREDLL